MTTIPFNFGKEIKKMSIDEDEKEDQSSNNNDDGYRKFIKDVHNPIIGFHSSKEEDQEEEWTNSFYGYEYKTIVPAEKESGPILGIRIELHIHKEKLDIIEKIVRLKYGTSSHTFLQYITEALVNQIETDLRSPESIAQNFCKNLLQKWLNETSEEVKKMQEKKPSPNTLLINRAGRDPLGW